MKRDHETSGSGADSKYGARSSTKPASSAPSRVRSVLSLQRSAGNRAVSSRLATGGAPIPIQRDYAELEKGLGIEDDNTSQLVEALIDVIGNSGSTTPLAQSLSGKEGVKRSGEDESPGHEAGTPESLGDSPGGSTKSIRTSTPSHISDEAMYRARQQAMGDTPVLTEAEEKKALYLRWQQIATIRSAHQKLFGMKLDRSAVNDLADLKRTTDEDFATITSRYKTLGPLAAKYKKAYGKDIADATITVNGAEIGLDKLLDPKTSDEDFAQFQTELNAKAKTTSDAATQTQDIKKLEEELKLGPKDLSSMTSQKQANYLKWLRKKADELNQTDQDKYEIRRLEGELEEPLKLTPKTDKQLDSMTPQKQAQYLKWLKKKSDDINGDEADLLEQQEMNKQLMAGFAKMKKG